MLRWLKTVVVSVEEKACVTRQVGTGKANVSEPLLTCRNVQMTSKPERPRVSGMSLAGARVSGQVVSGMEAARARSAALARNVGRRAATLPPLVCWPSLILPMTPSLLMRMKTVWNGPVRWLRTGPWSVWWRCRRLVAGADVQSAPVSEIAMRAAFSSTIELLRAKAEVSALTARLLIARG
jgi:hypothetical protein